MASEWQAQEGWCRESGELWQGKPAPHPPELAHGREFDGPQIYPRHFSGTLFPEAE